MQKGESLPAVENGGEEKEREKDEKGLSPNKAVNEVSTEVCF